MPLVIITIQNLTGAYYGGHLTPNTEHFMKLNSLLSFDKFVRKQIFISALLILNRIYFQGGKLCSDNVTLKLRFDLHHGIDLVFAFVDQLLHGAGEVFVVVDQNLPPGVKRFAPKKRRCKPFFFF